MTLCSLDGRIQPLEEARIHPLDRGFVFGDSLYEVIKVVDGRPLWVGPHLERLRSGLGRLGIAWPEGLDDSCREILEASRLGTGSLYLQVTRGVAPRSHRPPVGLEPTALILPQSHGYDAPASRPLTGATLPDPRWRHCDLKTTSLVATVLALIERGEAAADELIFRGREGELREGSHTNLFVLLDETIETHPLDGRVLPGVTRASILSIAASEGLALAERAPRLADLDRWSEAFLTGTYTGLQPLVAIDGRRIADGGPGPWTRRLAAALEAAERA